MLALDIEQLSYEEIEETLDELSAAVAAGDHYRLLDVDRAALDADLHNAYLGVTNFLRDVRYLEYDAPGLDESLDGLQSAVENAFSVMMDPDRRGVYDRVRDEARMATRKGWQAPAQSCSRARRRRPRSRAPPPRGPR